MMSGRRESLPYRIATWPARRPWVALAMALVLAIACLLGVRRISANSSIESMIDREDPAASAMVRVLHQFSAVEDLLVLVTAPAADAEGLVAYAGRLERAVQASAEGREVAEAVVYRPDEQSRAFFDKVLAPAGLYYLDDTAFEAARQRLTKDEMARQIARNEAMISAPGPAADALASALLQDPLRLHEFLLAHFRSQRGIGGAPGSDAFLSPDGRTLLIRVIGRGSVGDIEFSKQITETIGAIAHEVNSDGFEIDVTGAYAIAAASERAIRGDMIASVVTSVILLQVLFIAAYRRPIRSFFLAFAPVAVGILYGFGGYSLFSSSISPAIAVVGAILAGMGIDYSVHYLSHYLGARAAGDGPVQAVGHTSTVLGPSLLAACATSVIGFLAIGSSRVAALREFSLIGALGLIASLLATMWILPAVLGITDRGQAMRVRMGAVPLLHFIARHRRLALGASVSLFAASILVIASADELLPLESDLTVMHPRPNPPLDAQEKIVQRMGSDPVSLLVHLRADDRQQLLALAHRVDHQLATPAAREAGVVGTFGIGTLLPDPDRVSQRQATVSPAEADRVVEDFRAVIADSAFSAEAYEPYATFLRRLLNEPPAPGVGDLVQYPRLAETVLSRSHFEAGSLDAPEAITLVFLDRPLDQRPQRTEAILAVRDALRDLPGATLTGLSVIQFDTEQSIHRDLPRLLLMAGGLVGLYLLLYYRSLTEALLAALPTVFSLAVLGAFMRIADQDLNLMNLVAIPLLIGIDIDYGIFLVSLARRSRAEGTDLTAGIAASCHAIGVSALSTIFGFGSLIGTSVPAIRSLGWAVGVGVAACLVATLFLVAPLLIARSRRSPTSPLTEVPA